jgi:hypothetical protein
MTATEVIAAAESVGIALSVTPDGFLYLEPPPEAAMLDQLRLHKAAIISLLRGERGDAGRAVTVQAFTADEPRSAERASRHNPDLRDVEPDDVVEAAALRGGWVRHPGGGWDFPAAWTSECTSTRVEPSSSLRPLTAEERRQIHTTGAPLPPGVSFCEIGSGVWKRRT